MKNVFTFWEPVEKMPDYIKLCMNTWTFFGEDYKINIINYKNLEQFIGNHLYIKFLKKFFSLPKQADVIRCLVLKKYGGIWIDADTILLNNNIHNVLEINYKFILIGHHIAFICADKKSTILKKWKNEAVLRIYLYVFIRYFLRFSKKMRSWSENWNYLGNGIIDKYLNSDNNDFYEIKDTSIFLPEKNKRYNPFFEGDPNKAYIDFYFENKIKIKDLNELINENTYGLILLHNSWTPAQFKKLNKKSFLETNTTLAELLKLLNHV